ncbi:MAG TPA: hypothetical protein VIK14_09065 [Ignavibacteria bacterium]
MTKKPKSLKTQLKLILFIASLSSGSLVVGESDVLINGDIPLLAVPFKGIIESIVWEKAEKLFRWKWAGDFSFIVQIM